MAVWQCGNVAVKPRSSSNSKYMLLCASLYRLNRKPLETCTCTILLHVKCAITSFCGSSVAQAPCLTASSFLNGRKRATSCGMWFISQVAGNNGPLVYNLFLSWFTFNKGIAWNIYWQWQPSCPRTTLEDESLKWTTFTESQRLEHVDRLNKTFGVKKDNVAAGSMGSHPHSGGASSSSGGK